MTDHRSHPDQLMARALGVCWHSPTSDRWPCADRCGYCNAPGGAGRSCLNCTPAEEDGEPLADWEKELAHKEFRIAREVCGCDQDPIECNHEAALGQAEEKLRRVLAVCADLDRRYATGDGKPITGAYQAGQCAGYSLAAHLIQQALR